MKRQINFAIAVMLLATPAIAGKPVNSTAFQITLLDSDHSNKAKFIDSNLVNPWGMAQGPGSDPIWVSDNGTGLSTVYAQGTGQVESTVVTIPDGDPTGTVFVPSGTGFQISENGKSANALFLFDSEAGIISG